MMIGKSAYKQIQDSEINSRSPNKGFYPSTKLLSSMIFILSKSSWSIFCQWWSKKLTPRFLKNSNRLPVQGGTLLNSINEQVLKQLVIRHIISTIRYRSYYFDNQGLLSYTDFHFLLLLMSTPTRYLDIIFRGFDISADGNVEAKVTTNHLCHQCENRQSSCHTFCCCWKWSEADT